MNFCVQQALTSGSPWILIRIKGRKSTNPRSEREWSISHTRSKVARRTLRKLISYFTAIDPNKMNLVIFRLYHVEHWLELEKIIMILERSQQSYTIGISVPSKVDSIYCYTSWSVQALIWGHELAVWFWQYELCFVKSAKTDVPNKVLIFNLKELSENFVCFSTR